MQAGLSLTDEQARDQYWDSVISGAAIGGALAPVGRAYERYGEKKQVEQRQADLRNIDEQIAAKRQEEAAAAAEEAKRTPEYRQNLANEIAAFQQQLDIVGPLSKDKTQPADVRQEARQRMQSLKNEIATRSKELRSIKEQIGAIPTVEQSLQEQGYVVDDYGRLVKPDGKEANEQDYNRYFKELDKKRETEALLAKLQEQEKAQRINFADIQDDPAIVGLKNQIDTLSDPQALAQLPADQRQAQLAQIQDLQTQLKQASANPAPESRQGIENAIDSGRITPHVAKVLGIEGLKGKEANAADMLPSLQSQIDNLEQVRKDITKSSDPLIDNNGKYTNEGSKLIDNEQKLIELKRLRDVASQQVDTERTRAKLTPTLGEGEDWLTGAGQVRPTDEAAQQRLAAREQLSPAESRIQSTIETAAREKEQAAGFVPIEQGKSKDWYNAKATEAADTRNNSFDRLSALLEDYRSGAVLEDRGRVAEKGAGRRAGAITKASYTEAGIVNKADQLRQQILNAAIDEAAHQRMANGLRPLTSHEALVMRADINRMLQQYFKQSTALPKNHPNALVTRMVEPAQMRGTKLVSPAKYETADPRSITELPFQDQRAASKQFADVIGNKVSQYAEQGLRPVTAERL